MEHQGKRPDQVKFSEDVLFYGMVVVITMTVFSLFVYGLSKV